MRRAQSAPIDKSDCDDVRRFDRYLKEHSGHTGGWIEEEHLLFIKMKNKHSNNIEQICAAFEAFLIGKNRLKNIPNKCTVKMLEFNCLQIICGR